MKKEATNAIDELSVRYLCNKDQLNVPQLPTQLFTFTDPPLTHTQAN